MISLTPSPLSHLQEHRVVKHEDNLVKGQPWFVGLSQVRAPLVEEAPKLGGSAGKEGDGWGQKRDRQRLQASVVGWRLSHVSNVTSSHLHRAIWIEDRSGSDPQKGAL